MISKYKEYIIPTLLILLILICSGFAYYTYAKYITSITSDAEVSVARWNISVNNQDISSGSNFSNVITPVFAGTANIAPNVIAPTAEGYFDVVLDVTGTDVSLRYEITTSDNADSAVEDLVISGYSIDGGQRQDIVSSGEDDDEGLMVSGTIAYDSLDKEVDIRVYLKWNDDAASGAVMDNFDDADAASVSTNKAKVDVNVRVIQLPSTANNNNNGGSGNNEPGGNSGNEPGNGN